MVKNGMPAKRTTRFGRSLRRLMLALAVALLGVAAAWSVKPYWLAVLDTTILSELSEADLETYLQKLADRGHTGLCTVVEALGHSRPSVQRAACRVLADKIQRAAEESGSARRRLLDPLAEQLADQSPYWTSEVLSRAAMLAERIVAASGPLDASSAECVRRCHLVIAAQAQSRLNEKKSVHTAAANPLHAGGRRTAELEARSTSLVSFDTLLPGGNLPFAPAANAPALLVQEAASVAKPLDAAASQAQTSPITSPTVGNLATPITMAPVELRQPFAAASQAGSTAAIVNEPADDFSSESIDAALPSARSHATAEVMTNDSPPPKSIAHLLALGERLHGDNEADVVAAKAEAAERSISERQLKLARGAVDPNPAVRYEVAEALAVIDDIDTREWLLWLSGDRDVRVRRTALALIATSNDPRLKKRVREAAEKDANSQIREQARAALSGQPPRSGAGGRQ